MAEAGPTGDEKTFKSGLVPLAVQLSNDVITSEITHLVEDAIPKQLEEWMNKPYAWWTKLHKGSEFHSSKEEQERVNGIHLFQDLTLVQHAQVMNIMKDKAKERLMFATILKHTPRPESHPHVEKIQQKNQRKSSEKSRDDDVDSDPVDGLSAIPSSLLDFARTYGVKGGEVEAFVERTAQRTVADSFTDACIFTAGFAVFHSAQFFAVKCRHDEHHKERIEKMLRMASSAKTEEEMERDNEMKEEEGGGGGGREEDLESARSPRMSKKISRRTSLGMSANLLDSLETAEDIKNTKFSLHHSDDPADRLAKCLLVCADHDIDGANWHNEDHDMWTPLMIAAYNGNSQAVEMLLSDGRDYGDGQRWSPANWDTINCYGETTLHLLAHSKGGKSKKSIMKMLLDRAGAHEGDPAQKEAHLKMALHARTNPNGSRIPGKDKTHEDLVYRYGRKAAMDDMFEEHERERKSKCCGFRAPFLAAIFNVLDRPMREINMFFSRDYANGGHTVLQYAKKAGSLKSFRKYVKQIGMEHKD